MGTEDRLKKIMAQHARVAGQAKAAAEQADKVRAVCQPKWKELQAHVRQFVAGLNGRFENYGLHIFERDSPNFEAIHLALDEAGMERAIKIFMVNDGRIYVVTSSEWPNDLFLGNIINVTNEQIEGAIMDFLDRYTPK